MAISKEMKAKFTALAKSGAQKICGMNRCLTDFDCDHVNHDTLSIPPAGEADHVCPLAHYGVEPSGDARPQPERAYEETTPSDDELFALCACCKHAALKSKNGEYWVERTDFFESCVSCPVMACEDSILKCRAER